MYIDRPGVAYLVFRGDDGTEIEEPIQEFEAPGIVQGMHNMDDSIRSFARSCFNYALDMGESVWFGGKDTITTSIRKHSRRQVLLTSIRSSTMLSRV